MPAVKGQRKGEDNEQYVCVVSMNNNYNYYYFIFIYIFPY